MKFAKLIALTALLLTLTLPAQAAGPTLTMSPSPVSVSIGQTTPLAVKINNVQGLYGFDVKMKFDPTLVEVQDANPNTPTVELLPGDFLFYDLSPRNEADNAAGSTWIVVGQVNPHEAKDGSGILFTVYVKGKAAGRTAFEITEATFANRNGERIDVPLANVVVEVTSGLASSATNPTPLPTAPAPMLDLTQVVEQAGQTPVTPAPIPAEPTAAAPATATLAPPATAASPAQAAAAPATATLAPAEVASPTSAASAAAAEGTPAPAATGAAAQPNTQPSDATPAPAQAAAAEPTAVVESKADAAPSAGSAPAGLDAPTRVSTAAQQRGSNTLLFAGGGLLLLAAAGVIGLVVLRRGK